MRLPHCDGSRHRRNPHLPNVAGATVLAPFPETLPGTRDEAREVGRVLGQNPLVGPNARERALRRALGGGRRPRRQSCRAERAESDVFRLELIEARTRPTTIGASRLRTARNTRCESPRVSLRCETALGGVVDDIPAWRGRDDRPGVSPGRGEQVVATLWRIEDRGPPRLHRRSVELRDRPPAASWLSHSEPCSGAVDTRLRHRPRIRSKALATLRTSPKLP
jgi:hypothetical protein